MKHFARGFRRITAIGSIVCFYLAASTSDFHILELGQNEPESVDTWIVCGLLLLIPTALRFLRIALKRGLKNAIHR